MSSSAVNTAFVYACEPDTDASIATVEMLTARARERGMSVRAAVADTAARTTPLPLRRGWQTLAPLITAGEATLLVRSRSDLGPDTHHPTTGVGAVRVAAVCPEPWETGDWIRTWSLPRPSPADDRTTAGVPPGLCCVVFPALTDHVPAARRFAHRFLTQWQPVHTGWDVPLLLVAVSELLTNAVEHGSRPGDPVTLTLTCGLRELRVEVEDHSPRPPLPSPAHGLADGGRGLHLVGAAATEWGSTRHDTGPGKQVWMTVCPDCDPALEPARSA